MYCGDRRWERDVLLLITWPYINKDFVFLKDVLFWLVEISHILKLFDELISEL